MKSDLHKVLHPLAGKPMLGHLTDAVHSLGALRTVIVTGAGIRVQWDPNYDPAAHAAIDDVRAVLGAAGSRRASARTCSRSPDFRIDFLKSRESLVMVRF